MLALVELYDRTTDVLSNFLLSVYMFVFGLSESRPATSRPSVRLRMNIWLVASFPDCLVGNEIYGGEFRTAAYEAQRDFPPHPIGSASAACGTHSLGYFFYSGYFGSHVPSTKISHFIFIALMTLVGLWVTAVLRFLLF